MTNTNEPWVMLLPDHSSGTTELRYACGACKAWIAVRNDPASPLAGDWGPFKGLRFICPNHGEIDTRGTILTA